MSGGGDEPAIAVLDYGIGNLRSAEKALQHCGADARLVSDPEVARRSPAVVLPGVGAFGRCMEALEASGLDRVAREAASDGRPFLGICVGMQLLYEGSAESPAVAGLGILDGIIGRIPEGLVCPQMQWNRVDPCTDDVAMLAGLGAQPWMYFVHSYAAPDGPDVVATCDYGGPVVAAVSRGAMWATQFHPEKSGLAGLALLANFVAATHPVPADRH
ncbi:MAG: imidazole glycerol phosphate synthase subunit HisH [Actinomycetota bacterium]|nr:imidazole glycerol phosphate synthase subunit HisH [Actinomycetota bacterium]